MNTAVLLTILELALKYGVPAVQSAIEAMNKDKITEDDIRALPGLIRKPEEYQHERIQSLLRHGPVEWQGP